MIVQNDLQIISKKHPIIFFDGKCILCNNAVQFILHKDTKGYFKFTTLQKSMSLELVTKNNRNPMDSILVLYQGILYQKSEAVLLILNKLGLPYSILSKIFSIIPTKITDTIYQIIAKYRYAWFGKMDQCMLPPPDWASRFIL